MSLNGLEAPEVNEAYQSALLEGGGWCVNQGLGEQKIKANSFTFRLLLKYTSRDEVDLLGRGGGGLPEVQEVVDRYQEQSPLFGFIHYRRRKVVLKYVPAGTSRLLQGKRWRLLDKQTRL